MSVLSVLFTCACLSDGCSFSRLLIHLPACVCGVLEGELVLVQALLDGCVGDGFVIGLVGR
eukprot:14777408-Alexandrium_andersonii.AAC.1